MIQSTVYLIAPSVFFISLFTKITIYLTEKRRKGCVLFLQSVGQVLSFIVHSVFVKKLADFNLSCIAPQWDASTGSVNINKRPFPKRFYEA